MNIVSLSKNRKSIILITVSAKLAKVLFGLVLVGALYKSGKKTIALGILFGGGGYALGQVIDDWRNGRKPWFPIERVRADDFRNTPYQRGAKSAWFLGKLSAVIIGAYFVYVVYQAGSPRLAYAFTIGGGGWVLVKIVLMWRRGLKPWHPTKRIQEFE
ncbi:hypothetical protein [Halorhabdus rudnickae]|uniref:hypothetical protein n=1 Tax=Halorhabdus rudnickae TaxID=1775544 RepID=UPI001083D6F7|nr:hypothetical protein [Halorhabdus rudnickae]